MTFCRVVCLAYSEAEYEMPVLKSSPAAAAAAADGVQTLRPSALTAALANRPASPTLDDSQGDMSSEGEAADDEGDGAGDARSKRSRARSTKSAGSRRSAHAPPSAAGGKRVQGGSGGADDAKSAKSAKSTKSAKSAQSTQSSKKSGGRVIQFMTGTAESQLQQQRTHSHAGLQLTDQPEADAIIQSLLCSTCATHAPAAAGHSDLCSVGRNDSYSAVPLCMVDLLLPASPFLLPCLFSCVSLLARCVGPSNVTKILARVSQEEEKGAAAGEDGVLAAAGADADADINADADAGQVGDRLSAMDIAAEHPPQQLDEAEDAPAAAAAAEEEAAVVRADSTTNDVRMEPVETADAVPPISPLINASREVRHSKKRRKGPPPSATAAAKAKDECQLQAAHSGSAAPRPL